MIMAKRKGVDRIYPSLVFCSVFIFFARNTHCIWYNAVYGSFAVFVLLFNKKFLVTDKKKIKEDLSTEKAI